MISNATLRRQYYETAEQNRAGGAWKAAGHELITIMQLHRAYLAAERNKDHRAADEIRQRAQEQAAGGTSVRSGWVADHRNMEPEYFRIDLAGGGPAVRITGSLARFGQAEDAILAYQDWGTPWTEFLLMNDLERNAVAWFCNQFYWPGA